MPEVEIYHAKFGNSGMKNNEVMTVLVIFRGEGRQGGKWEIELRNICIEGVNKSKSCFWFRSSMHSLGILGCKIKK